MGALDICVIHLFSDEEAWLSDPFQLLSESFSRDMANLGCNRILLELMMFNSSGDA